MTAASRACHSQLIASPAERDAGISWTRSRRYLTKLRHFRAGAQKDASALRLFPEPNVADPTRDTSRVPAGRQLLPGARAGLGRSAQTVDYRAGFLVPLGAQEFVVLVAVREAGLDATSLAELDSWIASEKSVDSASARLAKAGFSVQRLSVREPK